MNIGKLEIGKITIETYDTERKTFILKAGNGGITIDEDKLEAMIIKGMSDNMKDLLQLNKEITQCIK